MLGVELDGAGGELAAKEDEPGGGVRRGCVVRLSCDEVRCRGAPERPMDPDGNRLSRRAIELVWTILSSTVCCHTGFEDSLLNRSSKFLIYFTQHIYHFDRFKCLR